MDVNKILFWIFFVLAIIFFIWYFVGDSPTLESGLLIFILSMLLKQNNLLFKQNNFTNDLKNKIENIEKRVDKIERK